MITDFGADIQNHLKKLECEVDQTQFLSRHQISAEYRAKMVDWMVEVLTTFKNSDQSFFIAIDLMDRYFKESLQTFSGSELHIAGIISMFVATKYEDVIPLLMKTVINKIGHNKFSIEQIENKEMQLLQTLSFKIGAPTIKDFIDRLLEELTDIIPVTE